MPPAVRAEYGEHSSMLMASQTAMGPRVKNEVRSVTLGTRSHILDNSKKSPA